VKLQIAVPNWIKLDPLRPIRVRPGDFFEMLLKLNEGDVVVSFLGPPLLSAEQRAKVVDRKVRITAFCSGDMPLRVDLKSLFDQNLLQAAVVSRPAPTPTLPATDQSQAWFDHFYQLITPANLPDLPAPGANRGP